MKTVTLILAAAALTVAGCASTGSTNTAPPPAGFNASASEFTGWARVQDGEIKLYAEQRDLRSPSSPCVSGALPRNMQRAAGDLNGSQVRLFGRAANWADREGGPTYNWQGSNIVNQCRRDVVILADRVEVIR